MSGPLDGIKVVELGVWVAGPAAAGILCDWGADVVKIEPPAGDPARIFGLMLGGTDGTNPVFELDNRGKRSIRLDLSDDEGMAVALELLDDADVFVTNIRLAALERLGLGPEQLAERNPGLVYALLSGYGTDGPDANRPAYDIAAYWARSGLASALQAPGGPLPFQRGGMGDHSAGVTGAGMVSAALFDRSRTGKGRFVSTSLLRQGAYTLGFDVNIALMWGRTMEVGVRETMRSPTVNNYSAGDGKQFWIVGLDGDRHWPPLARAVGREEWLTDERFSDALARAINAEELIALLDEIFATRTRDEWAEVFAAEPEFFWSPVNSLDDLVSDEQFHAAGGVVYVPTDEGVHPMVATPADFDGVPPAPRFRAPELGEHTEEILRELGRDDAAIARLMGGGAG